MIRVRDPKNLTCALLFLALAALLAFNALLLPIGTADAMGPGYFPLVLAIVLAGLGVVLALQSLRVDGAPASAFEWRAFLLVTLALIGFAITIGRVGFVPAVIVAVLLAVLASRRFTWRGALALTAFLLVFCWAVFVVGLGLPVRLFGA